MKKYQKKINYYSYMHQSKLLKLFEQWPFLSVREIIFQGFKVNYVGDKNSLLSASSLI